MVFDTALDELDHRQPQTFEIDFADPACNSSRSDAAEIGVMGDVADESDKLAIVKRRRDGVEIHDVLAAAVWIVGDDDVAGLQVFRPIGFHQFTHGDFKAGEQARRVMRLCDVWPFASVTRRRCP